MFCFIPGMLLTFYIGCFPFFFYISLLYDCSLKLAILNEWLHDIFLNIYFWKETDIY